MMRTPGRVICWDLDRTLISPEEPGRGRFIPNLQPLVEALITRQIRNVITTASTGGHAELVLGSSGMKPLFGPIFELEDICDEKKNKNYLPVAKALGIPGEEAPHRMLVVGDRMEDAAADLDLTFILHRMSEQCTADVYAIILHELMELSDSWSDAHAIMQLMARESYCLDGEFEGVLYSRAGITLAVGSSLADRSPLAPLNRLIEVHTVPDFLKTEKER